MKNFERQFISEIKSRPLLYKNNKKLSLTEQQQHRKGAWDEIAKLFKFDSADKAEEKWKLNVERYFYYMCEDLPFEYPKDMEFMQQYLFQTDSPNESSSSELDYQELTSTLQNDSDSEDISLPSNTENDIKSLITKSPNAQSIYFENQDVTTVSENDSAVEILWPADDLIYVDGDTQINEQIESHEVAITTAALEEVSEGIHLLQENNIESNLEIKVDETQILSSHILENTKTTNFQNFSSIELIFLGYAKTISNMPMPLQLKTKRKIAELMDMAEMEMMNSI